MQSSRIVTHSPLVYKGNKEEVDTQKLKAVKKAASVFEKSLNLRLEEDEYYFMADML
jgi:transcriptional regulatory protein LevR